MTKPATKDDKEKAARIAEAAQRALAEAEARRAERDRAAKPQPREVGGRDGPDPTRYGDWEKSGRCIDF